MGNFVGFLDGGGAVGSGVDSTGLGVGGGVGLAVRAPPLDMHSSFFSHGCSHYIMYERFIKRRERRRPKSVYCLRGRSERIPVR